MSTPTPKVVDRADAGPTSDGRNPKNRPPKFEEDSVNIFRILCCPGCGESRDMHQRAYEVYAREAEDGPATRVMIDNANCLRSTELSVVQETTPTAPSRRDSIAIEFECSECQRLSVLHIRQHKGCTLMWFTATKRT